MQTEITRTYFFEAAHYLPEVPDGHKCKRDHGHNYQVDVSVGGVVDKTGFIIDFWELDKIVDPIVFIVDHHKLNDIEGLENPTAENIAAWFIHKINTKLGGIPGKFSVSKVRVYETQFCWAEVSI